MKYYKAQTTNGAACCMSCALDKLATLDDDNQFLESSKSHLSKAVSLMDEYYRTWHSIIWIRSDRITKRRVREKLNNLAFDAYTAFVQATTHLNEYVNDQISKEQRGELITSPPRWWGEMLLSLSLSESSFQEEYRYEISGKQLVLF